MEEDVNIVKIVHVLNMSSRDLTALIEGLHANAPRRFNPDLPISLGFHRFFRHLYGQGYQAFYCKNHHF